VAYVLDSSRFETQFIRLVVSFLFSVVLILFVCRVEVETGKGLCAGQTVGDFYGRFFVGKPKNVNVALKMDIGWFWNSMLQSLKKANEQSPLNNMEKMRAT